MNKTGLILASLIISSLTACTQNAPAQDTVTGTSAVSSADTQSGQVMQYPDTDAVSAGNEPDVTKAKIKLSDDGITIQGSGAQEKGSTLVISEGGSYDISGSMTGQIYVEVSKEEEVELVLDNVTVTGNEKTGSPLYIKSADKVTVKMKKGTANTFTDTAQYMLNGEDDPSACIYSKDDITFKGKGSLTVNGNYKNGIYSKNDVRIKGGDITVNAVNDGITGKDSVRAEDGTVNITSGGNGIVSSNSKEDGRGLVLISGGSVNIASGGGAEGSTAVKGIKAAQAVQITGGTLDIDSSGDAVHSSGTFTADGGEFTISSGDDAIHADGDISLNNGSGSITNSYEGIEGKNITVNGGKWSVYSRDDGVNAFGDGSGEDFMPGFGGGDRGDGFGPPAFDGTFPENMPDFGERPDFGDRPDFPDNGERPDFGNMPDFENMPAPDGFPGGMPMSSGSAKLLITGGTLTVNAGGDGIDSNGSIEMTGGELYVDGPTDDGNGTIDYDTDFTVTSGKFAAAGSSGMAQTASSSEHGVLAVYFTSVQAADTAITLKSADGRTVFEYTPSKQFKFITLGSDDITDGTYTLCAGGTELCSVDISGITSINERGEAVTPSPFGFPPAR